METDGAVHSASGYTCPDCSGALWERDAEKLQFECPIGHQYEAAQLWIEHCLARNRALLAAARGLAENAALARRLATWTREQGNPDAATALDQEAAGEDRLRDAVQGIAEGLFSAGGELT